MNYKLQACAFSVSLCLMLGIYAGCAAIPAAENKAEPAKNGDEKEFSEIIKDFKPITGGLFTIYQHSKDGRAILEIKSDQFDTVYLCSVTRETGDGGFFDQSALQDNFPFFFRRVNNRIQLIHKNVLFRADRDKPIFRALEKGISDSMISSSVVMSKPHTPTGSVLVSLNDLFLFDRYNLAHHLSEATKADFGFDRENSCFSQLKTFPENVDIEINMHFRSGKSGASSTLADSRSLFIKYYYSICTLPKPGYVPRLADDRVGHFLTMYADYSSVKPETPYVRYVNRWRLEKSDPAAPLSPPKQPIVFWLEKTIPLEYRESVKKGVLLWNKAFEQAGFKDAMVVYQQPDDADWDPADVRYNTIRWMVSPGFGYAVGPSHDDPFTGELYAADIRISSDMFRHNYNEFEEFVNPLSQPARLGKNNACCEYGRGLAYQASLALSLMEARGFLEGKEEEAEKFVQDYVVDLVCHEVGHTLGLRHNFKSSIALPVSKLHDKELTSRQGLTGSVMDYCPSNVALDQTKQGEFWHSTVGPYDCWAIEYAYKPLGAKAPEEELAKLSEIASRCAQPELAYGTDEDAYGNASKSIDPLCNMWDLGSDPLEFAQLRIELANELWRKIEPKFSKPGQGYPKMRRVFRQGVNEYAQSAQMAARFIGGIYHRRDHIGDPDGKSPFEPVTAAKQKLAMEFLKDKIFNISGQTLPPAGVINKLGVDMMPDYGGGPGSAPTVEPQLYGTVLAIQGAALNYLYDPMVLNRVANISLRYDKDQEQFGLAELFDSLWNGIWSEIMILDKDGAWLDLKEDLAINPFRRNLQRAHLEKIISLSLSEARNGIPSDAIALARADLITIRDNCQVIITKSMGVPIDPATKAHIQDIHARVISALDWKVNKGM
ncbi:MAG: zinc-dependent metalloprotease [Candidatus Brocadiia bacterium]